MRPRLMAGWFVIVILCVTSAASAAETTIYGKLGGEVELKQDVVPATDTITSIKWNDGENLAMQLVVGTVQAFRHFKERGYLNTSTGVMTIKGLIQTDSKLYTPEINGRPGTPVHLEVISAVPVPTLKSCDNSESTCTLVCEGDTAGTGQVSYTWKADNNVLSDASENTYTLQKDSLNIKEMKEFSCELSNEFSRESSNSIDNPFTPSDDESKPNISVGITVFICLLLPLLLLVLFHKCKTGVCFYEKASMPWEADFWKKSNGPQRESESNGATRVQTESPINEVSPMTEPDEDLKLNHP